MHVLFIILNKTEFLDDILTKFVKIGIKGATILDSQGMGSALVNNENIPIFGALRNFLDSSRPYNKTIFTVLNDEELVEKAMQAVVDIVGDFRTPGVGLMFTLPIGKIYGLPKSNIEL